jgi:hypothetical protein
MSRIYKLDHYTKGTGASVAPLDDESPPKPEAPLNAVRLGGGEPPKPKQRGTGGKMSTPLPPGHVRKKSTGELGKVRSVDPQAGTVTVLWLRGGQTSTVPISSVSRR